jgi:hypothetical protein
MLATGHSEIVRLLNERGRKSGDGTPFTNTSLKRLLHSYGLKSREQRLRDAGMLPVQAIARGVAKVAARSRQPAKASSPRSNNTWFVDSGVDHDGKLADDLAAFLVKAQGR